MMAIVQAVAEVCGDAGRWVHYGATSNDILDTATGLQVRAALDLTEQKLRLLLAVHAPEEHGDENTWSVPAGRTARSGSRPPTAFALPYGRARNRKTLDRLAGLRPRVAVGQMTGAVGTQAALGPKGLQVQVTMMQSLGLTPVDVSNQVISRDRYTEYFFFLANVATSLDKIGIEAPDTPEDRDRRGRGGLREGPGRFFHDAAQAEPDPE